MHERRVESGVSIRRSSTTPWWPSAQRQRPRWPRAWLASSLLLTLSCAEEVKRLPTPPVREGSRLFLELAPGSPVFQQDSTHWVVAEGWPVYLNARRNETTGICDGRVEVRSGTASRDDYSQVGSDADEFQAQFRQGQEFADMDGRCAAVLLITEDTTPEPDEWFSLSLFSLTPGVGVDPYRCLVTVTIVDNDGLSGSIPAFHWPLDEDLVWTYRMRATRPGSPGHWDCRVETKTARVLGRRSFAGREFAVIGPWLGMSLSMDGPVAWLIPSDAPTYPPLPGDLISQGLWETFPRKMFDASQPGAPCAGGFRGSRASDCPWPALASWSDSLRFDGLSSVATPIGVFRNVLCVAYEFESEVCVGGDLPLGTHGGSRYYLADSVGVVAEQLGGGFFEGMGYDRERVGWFSSLVSLSRGR